MSILKNKIFNKQTVLQNLQTIFGIGKTLSKQICRNLGINEKYLFYKLKKKQINVLLNYIENENFIIESNLIIKNKNIGTFLKKIKTYKYFRHKYHLPVRGQRTHTNARTQNKIKHKLV